MKIQELEAVTSWQASQSPRWDGEARNWGEPGHPFRRVAKLVTCGGHRKKHSGCLTVRILSDL